MGTALQAERSRFRLPVGSLRFFYHLILPAALESTQPVTGMSTVGVPWG